MALNPTYRIFLNFAKTCILTCLSRFKNKKWVSPEPFLKYKYLKLKLRVFLTGYIVAMVTYYAMKMTTTCLPMIGRLCDTYIEASLDKEW